VELLWRLLEAVESVPSLCFFVSWLSLLSGWFRLLSRSCDAPLSLALWVWREERRGDKSDVMFASGCLVEGAVDETSMLRLDAKEDAGAGDEEAAVDERGTDLVCMRAMRFCVASSSAATSRWWFNSSACSRLRFGVMQASAGDSSSDERGEVTGWVTSEDDPVVVREWEENECEDGEDLSRAEADEAGDDECWGGNGWEEDRCSLPSSCDAALADSGAGKLDGTGTEEEEETDVWPRGACVAVCCCCCCCWDEFVLDVRWGAALRRVNRPLTIGWLNAESWDEDASSLDLRGGV
jgi:hypothetical protein